MFGSDKSDQIFNNQPISDTKQYRDSDKKEGEG